MHTTARRTTAADSDRHTVEVKNLPNDPSNSTLLCALATGLKEKIPYGATIASRGMR